MSYFSDALSRALKESGLSQYDLAVTAGISQGVVSKLKTGTGSATDEAYSRIIIAFSEVHPQSQVNLVAARCKDVIPDNFHECLDALDWKLAPNGPSYRESADDWDKTVEQIRKTGRYHPAVKRLVEDLAGIYG